MKIVHISIGNFLLSVYITKREPINIIGQRLITKCIQFNSGQLAEVLFEFIEQGYIIISSTDSYIILKKD